MSATEEARYPNVAEQNVIDRFEAAVEPEEIRVERVAVALWNFDLAPNDPAWDSEDAADQDYYRDMARDAIAALDRS